MFGIPSQTTKYTPIAGEDPTEESTQYLRFRSRPFRRRCCVVLTCSALVMTAFSLLAIYRRNVFGLQSSSHCLEPKLRSEWRRLSSESKQEYIKAVKCLHQIPSKQREEGRLSDDFPYVHIRVSGETHYTASFLLWHRYFIWIYESLLQDECGYTGTLPYWDWTLDWEDPTRSPIWASDDGFGGDGRENQPLAIVNNGSCILDGPFANYEVRYANQKTSPHCLSRGFGRDQTPPRFLGDAFAPDIIEALYSHELLTSFSMSLEETSHDAIPNGIGGDFSLFTAPNDPVWFLHHAQIDRLFWRWQNNKPTKRKSVKGLVETSEEVRDSLEAPMQMHELAPNYPASAVLDTELGMLCYTYI